MLTIHVRRVCPNLLRLDANEIVRVLVGDSYETRRVDALVVGDLLASHGVITRIEGRGREAA